MHRAVRTELKDACKHHRVPVLEGQISSGTIRVVPVLSDEVTLFAVRFIRKFVGDKNIPCNSVHFAHLPN